MSLDLSKPVQTRDGRKVRILCTDAKSAYPVIGLIEDCGHEVQGTWTAGGRNHRAFETDYDLINAPTKRTVWIDKAALALGRLIGTYYTDKRPDCIPIEIEY